MLCIKLQDLSDNANDHAPLPTVGSYMRSVICKPVHILEIGTAAYIHAFSPVYPQCSCYCSSSASWVHLVLVQDRMVFCVLTLLGISSSEDLSLFTGKLTGAQHMDHSPVMSEYGLIEMNESTWCLYIIISEISSALCQFVKVWFANVPSNSSDDLRHQRNKPAHT